MNTKTLSTIKILWLLNHSTLRAYEMDQLTRIGLTKIFLPKSFPYDEGNLSASVDYSYDESLSIPKEKLKILNSQCWYENISDEAWQIANQYFDIAIIGFFPEQIKSAVKSFKGAIVLRAFGLAKPCSYSQLLFDLLGHHWIEKIQKLKSRFWFGAGYEHLHQIESEWLAKRNCYLPVGLKNISQNKIWQGNDNRILFICPRIHTSPYFNAIYREFIKNFSDFDFTIGGAQPKKVNDPRVIGYVENEEYLRNMKSHKLMFYHSTEPNHIHYHPFEAIKTGMPLIFMAGGMLDLMGGRALWGRCKSIREAKDKITKIFNDNQNKLTQKIQTEQLTLLKRLAPEFCQPYFKKAFNKIIEQLYQIKPEVQKSIRIAIILPIAYRGGSLRGCISLINSIIKGALFCGDHLEVVFAYLENHYDELLLSDLNPTCKHRPFRWKTMTASEANIAMYYAGYKNWTATQKEYWIPYDEINYLLDCSLWIIISDRLDKPLLPIRPHILNIYDYTQRYVTFLSVDHTHKLINYAHQANYVFTTTEFTANDARYFAGVDHKKIIKMPMLVPDFKLKDSIDDSSFKKDYFLWTTNVAYHKAHIKVFEALELYYEALNGELKCYISGCNTNNLTDYYPYVNEIMNRSPKTKKKIKFLGELSDNNYKNTLKNAAFLFHSATVDNGTFSVIEAAQMRTPSLSSEYPAMQEINKRFNLDLTWVNQKSKYSYAESFKIMEKEYLNKKKKLLLKDPVLFKHTIEDEVYYWKVIKKCL